ncbi:hypothetical protein JM654_02660 [Microbacterium oxydans]|nr:hypothetical protein [Microbacterium oxydans]
MPRRREILARTLRRLPVLVPVVSVLLLAAGVGIGWAVFAPPSPEVTLTAVQQDRRDAPRRSRLRSRLGRAPRARGGCAGLVRDP